MKDKLQIKFILKVFSRTLQHLLVNRGTGVSDVINRAIHLQQQSLMLLQTD